MTGPVILGTFRTPEGFAVIKSELIDRISVQNPHLYRQDAEKIVNTIFSEITAAMARGDRVELRGFGVFFVKVREGRTGRNPRTGALVSVGSKAVPFFRSGREMKSLLNSYAHGSDIHATSLTASLTSVTFRTRPALQGAAWRRRMCLRHRHHSGVARRLAPGIYWSEVGRVLCRSREAVRCRRLPIRIAVLS